MLADLATSGYRQVILQSKKKKFSSTVQKENVQGQLESHVYNVSVPK